MIATVVVLQSLEGLSDRDAVQAVRTDLRWKVTAGLALDDEGFHPPVLTLWRNKLRVSDRPERVFQAVREVTTETGVLKGKMRRALDSTVLDLGGDPGDGDAVDHGDPSSSSSHPGRRCARAGRP